MVFGIIARCWNAYSYQHETMNISWQSNEVPTTGVMLIIPAVVVEVIMTNSITLLVVIGWVSQVYVAIAAFFFKAGKVAPWRKDFTTKINWKKLLLCSHSCWIRVSGQAYYSRHMEFFRIMNFWEVFFLDSDFKLIGLSHIILFIQDDKAPRWLYEELGFDFVT